MGASLGDTRGAIIDYKQGRNTDHWGINMKYSRLALLILLNAPKVHGIQQIKPVWYISVKLEYHNSMHWFRCNEYLGIYCEYLGVNENEFDLEKSNMEILILNEANREGIKKQENWYLLI